VITEKDAPREGYPTNFVTPREAQGRDEVFVSRVRRNEAFSNGLSFWVVSDNLRKGAALNAIQIVDLCVKKGFLAQNQKS
jgi:aspartate-semialdehyde dehydrogenase